MRVHKYKITQVNKYTGIIICHIPISLNYWESILVYKYTGKQVHKYTNTLVHKYTHKYTSMQVHKYTSSQEL